MDSYVYALNKATGALLWRTPLAASVLDAPVYDERSGAIFVTCESHSHKLYALNQASGAVLWSRDTPNSPSYATMSFTALSVDASSNVLFGDNGNFDPCYFTSSVNGGAVVLSSPHPHYPGSAPTTTSPLPLPLPAHRAIDSHWCAQLCCQPEGSWRDWKSEQRRHL